MFEILENRRHLSSVPLVPGSVVDGELLTANERDIFTFEATAGEQWSLGLLGTPITRGFSARAQIFRPNGGELSERGEGSHTNFFIPTSGTYTVEVFENFGDDTGTYALALERINAPSPDAQKLQSGKIFEGALSRGLQVDQYFFDVEAGEIFEIGLSYETISPGGVGRATLYDRVTGAEIRGFGTGYDRFTFTDNQPHQLVLCVEENFNDDTGLYSVVYERLNRVNTDTMRIERAGQYSGRIERVRQADHFAFTGVKAQARPPDP